MTTELAFKIMLAQRGIHHVLKVRRGTVGKWRHRYLINPYSISLEKKIELLQRAGYKMYQETRWVKINPQSPSLGEKEIDYLNDFPGLTLLGKMAGMNDVVIKQVNKSIIENPSRFTALYKKFA